MTVKKRPSLPARKAIATKKRRSPRERFALQSPTDQDVAALAMIVPGARRIVVFGALIAPHVLRLAGGNTHVVVVDSPQRLDVFSMVTLSLGTLADGVTYDRADIALWRKHPPAGERDSVILAPQYPSAGPNEAWPYVGVGSGLLYCGTNDLAWANGLCSFLGPRFHEVAEVIPHMAGGNMTLVLRRAAP